MNDLPESLILDGAFKELEERFLKLRNLYTMAHCHAIYIAMPVDNSDFEIIDMKKILNQKQREELSTLVKNYIAGQYMIEFDEVQRGVRP